MSRVRTHMQEDNVKNVPRSDKRTTSTKKNMRFENELIEEIERVRGEQSFSQWVKTACWEKLKD